jgi:hypothetical protein
MSGKNGSSASSRHNGSSRKTRTVTGSALTQATLPQSNKARRRRTSEETAEELTLKAWQKTYENQQKGKRLG